MTLATENHEDHIKYPLLSILAHPSPLLLPCIRQRLHHQRDHHQRQTSDHENQRLHLCDSCVSSCDWCCCFVLGFVRKRSQHSFSWWIGQFLSFMAEPRYSLKYRDLHLNWNDHFVPRVSSKSSMPEGPRDFRLHLLHLAQHHQILCWSLDLPHHRSAASSWQNRLHGFHLNSSLRYVLLRRISQQKNLDFKQNRAEGQRNMPTKSLIIVKGQNNYNKKSQTRSVACEFFLSRSTIFIKNSF